MTKILLIYYIYNNQSWQTVMDCRTLDGYTPMKKLIEKMPEVAEVMEILLYK